MTDVELLELIKKEYTRISPKNCWEFQRERDRLIPCLQILQKRFGGKTYNQILLMAGIDDKELNFVRRDREEAMIKFERISRELGHIPGQCKLQELGFSPMILIRYFGTYKNAVTELEMLSGLKGGHTKRPCVVYESNQELLQRYKEFSIKIGNPASCKDLNESDEIYNASVFTIRFSSMQELKRQAGFPIIDKHNSIYTRNKVERLLIQAYRRYDGRLTVSQIKSDPCLPAYATILRFYSTTSIIKVWEEIERKIIKYKDEVKVDLIKKITT